MGNLFPEICLTEGFKKIYVNYLLHTRLFFPTESSEGCPIYLSCNIKVRINHVTIRARMDREILLERAFCALWRIEQGILHLERA